MNDKKSNSPFTNNADLQNTGDNSFINTTQATNSKTPSTKEERQAKREKAQEDATSLPGRLVIIYSVSLQMQEPGS